MNLKDRLIVGAKVTFGVEYAKWTGQEHKAGEIITLVDGEFEHDNGLYTESQFAPSVWCESASEYDSIYHMFGNNLDSFMDCEIIEDSPTVTMLKGASE